MVLRDVKRRIMPISVLQPWSEDMFSLKSTHIGILRQIVHPISDRSTKQSGDRQTGPREGVWRAPCWRPHVRSEGERQRECRQDGLWGQFKLFQLGLLQSLGFGPPVLEPNFDLSLRQVERVGELGSLSDGEVLLLAKLALQRQQLGGSEGRARFPVVFVFP